MILSRDIVPIQVPSTLPVPPKAYLAYRSSIPNVVAVIERKEKTTTPPFAAEASFFSVGCLLFLLQVFCILYNNRKKNVFLSPSDKQGALTSARPLSVAFSLTSRLSRY